MIVCTVYKKGETHLTAEGKTIEAAAASAYQLLQGTSRKGLIWDFRRQEVLREEWVPPKWDRIDGELQQVEGSR